MNECVCINCGEELEGDGYTVVLHCYGADDIDGVEPDGKPVYCNEKDV